MNASLYIGVSFHVIYQFRPLVTSLCLQGHSCFIQSSHVRASLQLQSSLVYMGHPQSSLVSTSLVPAIYISGLFMLVSYRGSCQLSTSLILVSIHQQLYIPVQSPVKSISWGSQFIWVSSLDQSRLDIGRSMLPSLVLINQLHVSQPSLYIGHYSCQLVQLYSNQLYILDSSSQTSLCLYHQEGPTSLPD